MKERKPLSENDVKELVEFIESMTPDPITFFTRNHLLYLIKASKNLTIPVCITITHDDANGNNLWNVIPRKHVDDIYESAINQFLRKKGSDLFFSHGPGKRISMNLISLSNKKVDMDAFHII